MQEEKFKFTKYENHPEWDRIDVKQNWSEWAIQGYDDGDVSIECYTDDSGTHSLIMDQD